MSAKVDGGIEHRFLAHPDAVFHDGVGRAAHRAVGADGALDFDLAGAVGGATFGGLGLFHQRELRGRQTYADTEAGTAQKAAAVHGGQRGRQAPLQAVDERGLCTGAMSARRGGFFGQQHGVLLLAQIWVVL
ncbi:hypothetical protein D9M68_918270 [compost metagenome]